MSPCIQFLHEYSSNCHVFSFFFSTVTGTMAATEWVDTVATEWVDTVAMEDTVVE